MDINLLNRDEAAQLRDLVSSVNKVALLCHVNADGDALGSTLTWARYLEQQGKEATVIVPDMYPDFLQWMPGSERIVRYDKHPEQVSEAFDKADLVICLDFNRADRLHAMQEPFDNCKAPKILIDHHLQPDIQAKVTASHTEMCSTCELVFRIVWQLGGFDTLDR